MRSPVTGLVGNTLHTDNQEWLRTDSGIGAGIDSFYEYLLKVGCTFCSTQYLSLIDAVINASCSMAYRGAAFASVKSSAQHTFLASVQAKKMGHASLRQT